MRQIKTCFNSGGALHGAGKALGEGVFQLNEHVCSG